MHGTNLKLFIVQCCAIAGSRCASIRMISTPTTAGVYVQDAFPYLPAGERELFLTSVCPARTVLRISLASSRAAPVPLRG